jgi:hypothetical protein
MCYRICKCVTEYVNAGNFVSLKFSTLNKYKKLLQFKCKLFSSVSINILNALSLWYSFIKYRPTGAHLPQHSLMYSGFFVCVCLCVCLCVCVISFLFISPQLAISCNYHLCECTLCLI